MSVKINKIYTIRDARRAKDLAEAAAYEKALAEQAAKKLEQETLQANPHIGVLVRKGRTVYYTTTGGEYREGTLAELA